MVSFLSGSRKLSEVLARRTGQPWKFIRKRQTTYAYEYAYQVPNGFSVVDVQKHADALRAAVGGNVEVLDYAGVVVVRVIVKELPEKIGVEVLPPMQDLALTLGVDRAGCPVLASNVNPHLLVAGTSGSGKTDACRVYVWDVLRTYPDAKITICDMKGSSFLPFESLENVSFAYTTEGLVKHLQTAYDEMNKRIDLIRKTKKRDHPFPWHIILIDEIAELWARPGMKKEERESLQEANSLLSSLVRLGRELKIAVWLSTQYPTREVLHNQIQSNLVNRVCLYMDNPLEYEVILGMTECSMVLPRIPGRAFIKGHGVVQIPYGGDDEEWNKRLKGMKHKGDVTRTEETMYTDRFDEYSLDGNPPTSNILQWRFPVEASVRTPERIGKR